MRKAQQELRENLKKADADLEKFLGLIEKANQKQIDLRDREALLHKVVSLPINNPDLLKGLFREKAGGNNIKSLLDDLLVYHNLVATIDKLKSLEAMAQDETKSPDSQNRLSTLRHSLEHNLKQVTFKALQCTVNLVNKDIGSLLQLPEVSLTRILKPLCQLKDLRPVFFSQYGAHQKLRIKDVVTSWHISIRKGSIENLFQFTMETLTRYCASDLNVFEGRSRL